MISVEDFLKNFKTEEPEKLVRFATVSSDYTTGRPRLVFDGENSPSGKAYPKLKSFNPIANERVIIIQGVIIGAIE